MQTKFDAIRDFGLFDANELNFGFESGFKEFSLQQRERKQEACFLGRQR